MDWHVLLEKSLDKGEVRELHLYQIPLLKTCDNWGAVKELGKVDFKGKHARYAGGLVKYRNFKTKYKVRTEDELKKKRR